MGGRHGAIGLCSCRGGLKPNARRMRALFPLRSSRCFFDGRKIIWDSRLRSPGLTSLLAPEVRKVVQWVPGRCVAETALRIAECWNIADGVDRRAPFRRGRSRDDGVYQPVRFGGAGLWRLRSQMSVWCTLTMAVRRVCFPAFGPCRCCDASGHASQRRWSMEIMAWMQRSYAMLVQRCWMRRVCSWWCWEDNLRP
jgi:hypothetical protein